MRKLIQTDRSLEDLAEIWARIARDSPTAATRLLERIDAVVQLLSSSPYLGQVDERVGKEYRRLIVSSYLIFYTVDEDAVRVLRVYHSARRIEDLNE